MKRSPGKLSGSADLSQTKVTAKSMIVKLLCIPDENGHGFRRKMAAISGPKWPWIPVQNGQFLSE